MKKTSKIIVVVTALVAIVGWIISLIKKCNKLIDLLSKAEDLIIGQDCYITFIRSDMRSGFIDYREDKFGVFAKHAKDFNEKFYQERVMPFVEKWNKRYM